MRVGDPMVVGNEFAEVKVWKAETRNGARLLIQAAAGSAVMLCPLELEALTWQDAATFTAMIARPFEPLISGPDEDKDGVQG